MAKIRKRVVIHSISTSNHNFYAYIGTLSGVVIHSISTSNHNLSFIIT